MADEITKETQEAIQILSIPENLTKEEFKPLVTIAEQNGWIKDGKFLNPFEHQQAPNDPLTFIKQRFGDYDSVDQFLGEAERWKLGSETNLTQLSGMPTPLLNAIQAHVNGQDWRSVLKDTNLVDLTKSYNDRELLNIYFPNKFSEEELNDAENIAVKKAIGQAKQSFELDKQTEANNRRLAEDRQRTAIAKQEESFSRSAETFKKYFPHANDSQIARLKKEFTSGNYQNLFFNSKGEFTEDALLNLFPLVFPNEYRNFVASNVVSDEQKKLMETVEKGGQPKQFNRAPVPANQTKTKADAVRDAFGANKRDIYKLTPSK